MYTRSMHHKGPMYTRGLDFVAAAVFWDISSRVVCRSEGCDVWQAHH